MKNLKKIGLVVLALVFVALVAFQYSTPEEYFAISDCFRYEATVSGSSSPSLVLAPPSEFTKQFTGDLTNGSTTVTPTTGSTPSYIEEGMCLWSGSSTETTTGQRYGIKSYTGSSIEIAPAWAGSTTTTATIYTVKPKLSKGVVIRNTGSNDLYYRGVADNTVPSAEMGGLVKAGEIMGRDLSINGLLVWSKSGTTTIHAEYYLEEIEE